MNKTTQVPTEWLEDIKGMADKLCDLNTNANDRMLCQAMLVSHIKASKYFQPQPESNHESFNECLQLLRDLADFQNGAPLEQHKVEYEKTMDEVWDFLRDHENDSSKHQPESLDVATYENLNEFIKFYVKSPYFYDSENNEWGNSQDEKTIQFSEVYEAFKKSKL
jgi:hypothetical protein